MEFLELNKRELKKIFNDYSYKSMITLCKFTIDDIIKSYPYILPPDIKNKKYNSVKRDDYVKVFTECFQILYFKNSLYSKMTQTKISKEIYQKLVWDGYNDLESEDFDLKLKPVNSPYREKDNLQDNLGLISRVTYTNHRLNSKHDNLSIESDFRKALKLCFPIPDDFNLLPCEEKSSDFTYSNENEVLEFISIISDMLKNNLVQLGKTGEKPLAKTLNILKSSTPVNEFYSEKKLDSFAVDMLTRSFYYFQYENSIFKNEKKELEVLKEFTELQLNDRFDFVISRIFISHLKKVKFGTYYQQQKDLFNIVIDIINKMPRNDWVNFDNIIKYCTYRDYEFHYESDWKTQDYYIESDDGEIKNVGDYYDLLFFDPILKACFFYLGALGVLELKYDRPISEDKNITLKDKPYISVWDGLKQIKFTELGKYIIGFSKTYTPKEIVKKKTKLKFDEYKPIITVDKSDTIMIAKLEPFTDKYDENRYILSYSKMFKECKKLKELELKINSFYNKIESNPPKVFKEFFDDIKNRANMLKRDLKQVVIELKNDKKLLNLFMTNKKLQEIIIKASGYRVIVAKEDIPKLSKIVKDNGFFIEF